MCKEEEHSLIEELRTVVVSDMGGGVSGLGKMGKVGVGHKCHTQHYWQKGI